MGQERVHITLVLTSRNWGNSVSVLHNLRVPRHCRGNIFFLRVLFLVPTFFTVNDVRPLFGVRLFLFRSVHFFYRSLY